MHRFSFAGLCLLLVIAISSPAEHIRPSYTVIAPGLDYAHVAVTNFGITNIPWSIQIARMDRTRKDLGLIATLAKNHIEGLGTVAEQARSIPASTGRAVAAVNGDFFVIKAGPYQGDPHGLEIVGGELVSGPGQASLWIEKRQPHIEPIESRFQVRWPDGQTTAMGLNESSSNKPVVLFTPTFGSSTKATNTLELILARDRKRPWLPLRASEKYRARVKSLNEKGDSRINANEMVLTVSANAMDHLPIIHVGSVIEISTELSKNLSRAEAAIGGNPLLLANGQIQARIRAARKNYLIPRHPRTAVGYNSRYIFLVEVDGRQPELSLGMNLEELAGLMRDLGCTEAMNLDGGGSATFWLEGKVMNSPSDKHERAVANALVVVKRLDR